MRPWRPLLVAICLCAAVINGLSLFTDHIEASSALGYTVSLTHDPAVVHVDSVDAGGAAAMSGVRAGDLIQLRDLPPGDRYRLLTGVYPHERIPFTVIRGTHTIGLIFRAGDALPWRWDIWMWCIASFWMLGFALLIAWRCADLPEARALCLILALYTAGNGLATGSWIGISPFADMLTAMIATVLIWTSAALLATYAASFGRPLSPFRRTLTGLAYAAAAGVAVNEIFRLLSLWNGGTAWVAQSYGPDWTYWWGALPYLTALLCALAGISSAQGAERARITWTTAAIGLLFAAQAAGYLAPMFLPASRRGDALVLSYELYNVGGLLAPLGMTYALFNRRLLDIGFAINRIAIFTTVSAVIVGIFMLAEWAFGTWLQQASHTANLAAEAAVALALGFSIRFIHARVEHVLDTVFFRKRHDDEQAIRRFAGEAAFMTDADKIVERAIAVLERYADASFALTALDDGRGRFGGVDENDPAIVSLRTWHRVQDLHGVQTEFFGDFAYPMVARGRLVGALLLGPKRSQESYAPDESNAIEELAHGVAVALDVLGQGRPERDDSVAAELRALREAVAEGFAAMRTPQAKL